MLLIPIGLDEHKVQRVPWVTYVLIALNSLIFLYTFLNAPDQKDLEKPLTTMIEYYAMHPYLRFPEELKKIFSAEQLKELESLKGEEEPDLSAAELSEEQTELDQKAEMVLEVLHRSATFQYGHRPANPVWWSYFTSIFLHADLLHLLGNMLFLYLAGCSLEDVWGKPLYLSFYLSGGIVATLFHDLKYADSMVPLIGASGAIAALMGAFLVRFYKTNIRFFYLLGIWIRGKFSAPAWVVLPVWLVLQLIMDKAAGGEAGVAFVAHIGGFLFGGVFGILLNMTRFEEHFVAPYIEGKVSIPQSSDFMKALDCVQKMDYVQAKTLLTKTIQQEPDHLEAYVELRRLGETTGNEALQVQATAGLLEMLVRKKETDLVRLHYGEFNRNHGRESLPLPAKTMMIVGIFFEQIPDFRTCVDIYDEVARLYPQDPLCVKALSRAAIIQLDRLDQRNIGGELLKQSYLHPAADDSWRSLLKTEFLKHQLPLPILPAPLRAQGQRSIESNLPAAKLEAFVNAGSSFVELPDAAFEANASLVTCWIDSLAANGLKLKNESGNAGMLPWKRIRFISVGRIRDTSAAEATQARKDYLVVDLLADATSVEGRPIAYRTFSYRIDFKKLVPGSANVAEAYRLLIKRITEASTAVCIPDTQSCKGPEFRAFNSMAEYEKHLAEYLSYAE